jgi:hypothetical protein
MADSINAEVCILIDCNGDYAIGADEAGAREAYEENIQALTDCDGFRLVKVTVAVPLPSIVELAAATPPIADVGPLAVQ